MSALALLSFCRGERVSSQHSFPVLFLLLCWLVPSVILAQCPAIDLLRAKFRPNLIPESSGLSILNNEPKLVLAITTEKVYYNNTFNVMGYCNKPPTVSKRDFPDDPVCVDEISVELDYVKDCAFDVMDDPRDPANAILLKGRIIYSVNADVDFLGVVIKQSYERPFSFQVKLQKTFSLSTVVQVTSEFCLEASDCNNNPCLKNTATNKNYCDCTPAECFSGYYCETDICAPILHCPTLPQIELIAGLTLADAWLGNPVLNLSLPPLPYATDPTDEPSELSISRQINGQASQNILNGQDDLYNITWGKGTYVVRYVVSDSNGLGSECAFTVVVKDLGPPVITCPADVLSRWQVGWGLAIATDLIDEQIRVYQLSGPLPSAIPAPGVYTVVMQAEDNSGNTATCNFNVIWDNEPPRFNVSCPSYSGDLPLDSCDVDCATASWKDPATVDDITEVVATSLMPLRENGGCFRPGSYDSFYVASDLLGNSITCGWMLTVRDNCPPIVTCQKDVIFQTETNQSYADVNINDLGSAFDVVGLRYGSPSYFPPSQLLSVGSYLRNYEGCDSAGNCASCILSFEVRDLEPPTFSYCPPTVTKVRADQGLPSWTVIPGISAVGNGYGTGYAMPIAVDNVGVVSESTTVSYGDKLSLGLHNMAATAVDAAGNVGTCTFSINVTLGDPPPMICPAPAISSYFVRATDAGQPFWSAPWASLTGKIPPQDLLPGVSWNIQDPAVRLVDMTKFKASATYPGGTLLASTTLHQIMYDMEDSYGLFSIPCSFFVRVVDEEEPTLTCSDIVATLGDDLDYASVSNADATSTAWDNFQVDTSLGFLYDPPLNRHTPGTYTVTGLAFDIFSNKGTCEFDLIVQGQCGDALVIPADGEECDGGVGCDNFCKCMEGYASYGNYSQGVAQADCLVLCFGTCTVVNNCESSLDVTNAPSITGALAGTSFMLTEEEKKLSEETFVHVDEQLSWSASNFINASSDADLNLKQGEFVFFEICCNQTEIPPHPLTAIVYVGEAGSKQAMSTYDHCVSLGTVVPQDLHMDGCWKVPVCRVGGVEIGLLPENQVDLLNCLNSGPIMATVPNGQTSAPVMWNNFDYVAFTLLAQTYTPAVTLYTNYQTGHEFEIGNYTLEITATDWQGAVESCFVEILVGDSDPPVLFGCPTAEQQVLTRLDPVYNPTRGGAFVTFELPPVQAIDTNDGVTPLVVVYTPTEPVDSKLWPQGTTLVTYTATDQFGNSASCNLTVVVKDVEDPVLLCRDFVLPTDAGQPTVAMAHLQLNSIDNADPPTTHNITIAGPLWVGSHDFSFCHTDSSGNGPFCCYNKLVVEDREPPVYDCPVPKPGETVGKVELAITTGSDVTFVHAFGPTDNDPANLTYSSSTSSTTFALGTTRVVLVASDSNPFNSVNCAFDVVVKDEQPPDIFCMDPPLVVETNSKTTSTYPFTNKRGVQIPVPSVSDNSGVPLTARTDYGYAADDSLDTFDLGTTTVTFYATDLSGNRGECNVTVIILDGVAPEPNSLCPSDYDVYSASSPEQWSIGGWYVPEDAAGLFFDNVGVVKSFEYFESDRHLVLGENNVVYEAEDARGNKGWCNFTITLVDNEAPKLTCPGDFTRVISNAAEVGLKYEFNLTEALSATDDWTPDSQLVWEERRDRPSKGVLELKLGFHNLVYTVTDLVGNQATCSFTADITNTYSFRLYCPATVERRMPLETYTSLTVIYEEPAYAEDDTNDTIFISYDPPSGSQFSLGYNNVVVTATDQFGNTITCTFQVWIKPAYPPPVVDAVLTTLLVAQRPDGAYGASGTFILAAVFPFQLKRGQEALPAGTLDSLEEVTSERNCPTNIEGANCIYTYAFSMIFLDCDASSTTLDMQFFSDCWPTDCYYSDQEFRIQLNLAGDSYCANSLAPISVSSTVSLLTPLELVDWKEDKLATTTLPPTTTTTAAPVAPPQTSGICPSPISTAEECAEYANALGDGAPVSAQNVLVLSPLDYRPAGCYRTDLGGNNFQYYLNPDLVSNEECSILRQCLCPTPIAGRRRLNQLNIADRIFNIADRICVVAEMKSPDALLSSSTLTYVKVEHYFAEPKTPENLRASFVLFDEERNGVVAAPGYNVTYDDSNVDFISFEYTDLAVPLDSTMYVTVIMVARVEYLLLRDAQGSTDENRRRTMLVSLPLAPSPLKSSNTITTRRSLLQSPPPEGVADTVGEGSLILSTQSFGDNDVKKAGQTNEKPGSSLEILGLPYYYWVGLLLIFCMCFICLPCCFYKFSSQLLGKENKLSSDEDEDSDDENGSTTGTTTTQNTTVTQVNGELLSDRRESIIAARHFLTPTFLSPTEMSRKVVQNQSVAFAVVHSPALQPRVVDTPVDTTVQQQTVIDIQSASSQQSTLTEYLATLKTFLETFSDDKTTELAWLVAKGVKRLNIPQTNPILQTAINKLEEALGKDDSEESDESSDSAASDNDE